MVENPLSPLTCNAYMPLWAMVLSTVIEALLLELMRLVHLVASSDPDSKSSLKITAEEVVPPSLPPLVEELVVEPPVEPVVPVVPVLADPVPASPVVPVVPSAPVLPVPVLVEAPDDVVPLVCPVVALVVAPPVDDPVPVAELPEVVVPSELVFPPLLEVEFELVVSVGAFEPVPLQA
jgi:hypothetical protein